MMGAGGDEVGVIGIAVIESGQAMQFEGMVPWALVVHESLLREDEHMVAADAGVG
jgi:hypothetical protein